LYAVELDVYCRFVSVVTERIADESSGRTGIGAKRRAGGAETERRVPSVPTP
jgi:hypothetical protein